MSRSILLGLTLAAAVQLPASAQTTLAERQSRELCFASSERALNERIGGCTRLLDWGLLTGGPRAYVLARRGLLKSGRNDLVGANADFDEAIRLAPDSIDALVNRSHVRTRMGDKIGAASDLDAILQIDPRNAAALGNRGNLRRGAGDLKGALADFDAAIAVEQRLGSLYYNRGATRISLGDRVGAKADFDAAIERDSKLAEARIGRGYIRCQEGDLVDAMSDFDEAVRLNPTLGAGYFARGDLRQQTGDLAGALADYNAIIAMSQGNERAYFSRVQVNLALGDLPGAMADIAGLVGQLPNSALPLAYRCIANFRQGAIDQAKQDCDVAVSRSSAQQSFAYEIRAGLRWRLNDLAGADSDIRQATAGGRPRSMAVWLRSRIRASRGDAAGSAADAESARKEFPRVAAAFAERWGLAAAN